MTSYLTVAGPAEAEVEARRSRFVATVERVEDEAAARAVVERLRREHWDARHHCSAFVLGTRAGSWRSSRRVPRFSGEVDAHWLLQRPATVEVGQ